MTKYSIDDHLITLQELIDFKEINNIPGSAKIIIDNEGFDQSQCHSVTYNELTNTIHLFSEG